jgi:hypothetical protein
MTFTHDKVERVLFYPIILVAKQYPHQLQKKLEYINNIHLRLQAKHVGHHKNSMDTIEFTEDRK